MTAKTPSQHRTHAQQLADFVVRPHEPMILAEYQRLLSGLMMKLHQAWQNRSGVP